LELLQPGCKKGLPIFRVSSGPDLPGNIGSILNPSQGKTGVAHTTYLLVDISGILAVFWLWFICALCTFFFFGWSPAMLPTLHSFESVRV
jgi:hypothetical protein